MVYSEIFDEICWTTTWTRNTISIRIHFVKTIEPIFTKILHDIVALVALFNHEHGVIPFRFWMPERRVKVVDFDVSKMLQNYLVTIATSLGLPQHLCKFCNPHTCDYLCWKADEDRISSCRRMDDDRKIEAQLQRNFHLLECSPPKLLDRSSPKFYTI